MLYWTALFLVITIILALLGFAGPPSSSAYLARSLFYVLGSLSLISVGLMLFKFPRRFFRETKKGNHPYGYF